MSLRVESEARRAFTRMRVEIVESRAPEPPAVREHAVTCSVCLKRKTWTADGLCSGCREERLEVVQP